MSVTASVIDKCNYNCEYCCNSFPRTNKVLDSVKLIDFIAYVKTLTSKTIQLTLIGGETMLYPNILQLCEKMKEMSVECIIYSNFSFAYQLYDAMPENVKFIVSWHNGSRNDIFLKNLSRIQKEKLDRYIFYVMYEHDNIGLSISMYNKIKSITSKVTIKQIYNTGKYVRRYSDFELKAYDKIVADNVCNNINAEDCYMLETNNAKHEITDIQVDETINPFRHWKCLAGSDCLYIADNGDIYPCCALQQVTVNGIELFSDKFKLGNICSLKQFKLKTIIACNAMRCCNFEIKKQNVLNKKLDNYLKAYV